MAFELPDSSKAAFVRRVRFKKIGRENPPCLHRGAHLLIAFTGWLSLGDPIYVDPSVTSVKNSNRLRLWRSHFFKPSPNSLLQPGLK